MKDNSTELAELRSLYDELWSDARTLVKDLRKGIAIYLYAGLLTLVVTFSAILSALPYYFLVLSGAGNMLAWFMVVLETVAAAVIASFGTKLLMWYRKLTKRYAKLIEMEKDWRSANA